MRPHGLIIFLLVLQGIDTQQIDEYFFTDYRTNGKPSTTKGYDCGGEYNSSRGTIRHPLSGGNYANNENCTWIIRAASPIEITFAIFDTEEGSDYLYVRDGEGIESHALFRFSGDIVPSPVQTRTNTAILLFTSDTSNTRTGFEFHWRLSGPPEVSLNLQGGKRIYDEGTLVNASCHVRAYPTPDISWRYFFCNEPVNCTDDYMNMASYITTDGNKGNSQFVSGNTVKSSVQFPAVRSGQLQCLGKNSLGFSKDNRRVIVRPEPLITAEDYWTTGEPSSTTEGYVSHVAYVSVEVEPPELLIQDHGDGNYTIKEGANITLTCEFTYTGKTWFLNWTHPVASNKHVQWLIYEEIDTEWGHRDVVSRELHIQRALVRDSGEYSCFWKKGGGNYGDHPPQKILLRVDTQQTTDPSIIKGYVCNSACKFPFIYEGVTYNQCTSQGFDDSAWCATETDNENNYISLWTACDESCIDPCPSDFFRLDLECFLVVAKKINWKEARAYCQNVAGDLAQPNDLSTLRSYLKERGADEDYWIGGSDTEAEGTWKWLNGTEITEGWEPDQPGGDREQNCLDFRATNNTYLLNDYACTYRQKFICEQ